MPHNIGEWHVSHENICTFKIKATRRKLISDTKVTTVDSNSYFVLDERPDPLSERETYQNAKYYNVTLTQVLVIVTY